MSPAAAGRARRGPDRRRGPPLQPPPDHPRRRDGRAEAAQERPGAVRRRGRPRLAGADVPRRGRRRHPRASSSSTPSTSPTCSARSSTGRATSAGPRPRARATPSWRSTRTSTWCCTRCGSTPTNVMEIFGQYDLIVDGTDNFATRYLVNDACVLLGKPYVWGSIYRFDGQASVFWAEHGPCYRCLYPEPPPPGMVPSCAEGGVLGVLCASIGSIQVTEAIKLLTGIGEPLVGRLMVYDALEMTYRTVKVRKDPECAVCGKNPTVTELIDYEAFCGTISDGGRRGRQGLDDHGARPQGDDRRRARTSCSSTSASPNEYEIVVDPRLGADPEERVPQRRRRSAQLPQDKPIVLHCKTGHALGRGARGAQGRRVRRRGARRRRRRRRGSTRSSPTSPRTDAAAPRSRHGQSEPTLLQPGQRHPADRDRDPERHDPVEQHRRHRDRRPAGPSRSGRPPSRASMPPRPPGVGTAAPTTDPAR